MTKILSPQFAAALLAVSMMSSPVLAAETHTTHTTRTSETRDTMWPQALSGVYVGGQVGYSHPVHDDDTLDNTASFTGLVGYRFNDNFRSDIEVSYRKNDYSETAFGLTASGDAKGWGFLLNGWYDFRNASAFTPYLGGGIGFSRASDDINEPVTAFNIDDDDTAFAYQLGAGAAYALTSQVDLTVDYRFIDTSPFKFDTTIGGVSAGTTSDDYTAHEIRAGVRYSF